MDFYLRLVKCKLLLNSLESGDKKHHLIVKKYLGPTIMSRDINKIITALKMKDVGVMSAVSSLSFEELKLEIPSEIIEPEAAEFLK